jgi:putative transposase
MTGKRHSAEQIVGKLREADALLGGGASMGQVCQKLEVSEATYCRWRNQYGGMKSSEAKRLKELEVENARLKRLVAEQALDIQILKEAARPNS